METKGCYSGQELREMFAVATSWLEKSSADIDALNVFPVPDGDTGTNMLLTMRSTIEEAYRAPDHSATAVAQAMAQGALLGARGNSGVILSQIFRGIAKTLEGKETFASGDFAQALLEGSSLAYKALSKPVEGTMLTVIKEASSAAWIVCTQTEDLLSTMETAVKAARESVANTPRLLQVLREAGVVDAGGQGLYVILEGALLYLQGKIEEIQYLHPQVIPSSIPLSSNIPQLSTRDEEPYGYCIEFLLKGRKLSPAKMRKKLDKKGQSVIAVGDDQAVRVHIHSLDPAAVFRYATSLGALHQIKIQNMDDQHLDFMAKTRAALPTTEIAIIAVVSGDGLEKVFKSLGVASIVPGGQTMNPSTQALLRAVESVPSPGVIILPNNKNVILAAKQVESLTSKKIKVVPTESIPQGVAALLAFNYDADLDTNATAMEEAKSGVNSIEITRAVRSARFGHLKIGKKQAIGLIDGEMVAVAPKPLATILNTLRQMKLDKKEIITIYHGVDTEQTEAEDTAEEIRQQYPHLQIELIYGGQPHYNYILSVE